MSDEITEPYNAHHVVDWTHYLTHAEVDVLQAMARELPDEPHVVNLGSGNGTSGLALMQARPDLHLYTVDIQLESSPFGCLEGEEAVFRKAGVWGDPRYTQIHGDSAETGRTWRANYGVPLDMVFIDAGHQEHECRADILAWRPLLKRGGILAIHDYEKKEKVWVGVNRAVKDLMRGYKVYQYVDTLIAYRISER